VIHYPFADCRPVPQLALEVERLRRLAEDLNRIGEGEHPDERALAQAPTINDWGWAERPEMSLFGKVYRHPTIADGRQARTSDVWFVAPALGYARTLNRFYNLGRQFRFSDGWDFR
jgi:hypothetical protein